MAKHYLFFVMQPYSFAILRPLQEEIWRRGDKVAWFLNGSEVDPTSLTENEVLLASVAQVKAFNPRAVFVPGNIVPDFFPGIKVQVFHGLEYKKKGHFAIRGFFDLYCTFGPMTTEPFKQLAKKHKYFDVVETGWLKLDPYFNYQFKKNEKPTILYAPTFSPSLSSLEALHQQIKLLCDTGKYQFNIKFHPKTQTNWMALYESIDSEYLTISRSDNLIPLIQQADVVISDTSSAVDESLLMGKPVITFNNVAPQPALIDITKPDELANAIDEAINISDEHKTRIQDYINQTHPYQDGKSTLRVLDATENKIQQGEKRKPLNLIRKYKIRKKLNYMKLS